jgi:IclR family KDG regulon transcriptional repressor
MNATKQKSRVNSIFRAARILSCLIDGTNTVTDIARSCQLSKSTVHRLLKSLEESGLVSQEPFNHHYYLGHLFTRLSLSLHLSHSRLVSCALEEMKYLSNVTSETIILGIQVGLHYIRLNEIPSKHSLKVTGEDEVRETLFAGAIGKVLLSQLNDSNLNSIVRSIKLERLTENTITDKELFITQVKQARQRGYAYSIGEVFYGAVNISAPIKNYVCPAYLSIIGPQHRIEPRILDFSKELKKSAIRISETLKKTV